MLFMAYGEAVPCWIIIGLTCGVCGNGFGMLGTCGVVLRLKDDRIDERRDKNNHKWHLIQSKLLCPFVVLCGRCNHISWNVGEIKDRETRPKKIN